MGLCYQSISGTRKCKGLHTACNSEKLARGLVVLSQAGIAGEGFSWKSVAPTTKKNLPDRFLLEISRRQTGFSWKSAASPRQQILPDRFLLDISWRLKGFDETTAAAAVRRRYCSSLLWERDRWYLTLPRVRRQASELQKGCSLQLRYHNMNTES